MANVKDKLVTVESLSVLHDYNKKTYATKEFKENNIGILSESMTFNVGVDINVGDVIKWSHDNKSISSITIYKKSDDESILFDTMATSGNSIPLNDEIIIKEDYMFVVINDGFAVTLLHNIVPIVRGGTGSNDGATGLANLFASGSTVLSSYQYGDELPEAGTVGRIFFKRLTDI